MFKRFTLIAVLLFFSLVTFSQNSEVNGSLKDTATHVSLTNTVIALLSAGDSTLRNFTRAKDDGSYTLKNVKNGKYILKIMHPLFGDYIDDIEIKNSKEIINTISLTPKSKLLEAIILKSGSPIRIKGDTTIYTADSFKVSANANVEELLKKMPGFQVDKNGQIKSMGEVVEKVLVDGEEFFGDDPGMAVKNLRADAVKEVQVFNKKSEQSEFTGIDDGKTSKTINLKLKEDKKIGYFGKIDLAGGSQKNIDDRYNTNILLSSFKGKRKLSGFLLSGNTGQDGLSWRDMEKYGNQDDMNITMDEDGGMMMMWRGGSTDEEPYVNTENGFIKNINAGIQYTNKWNDKQTLNFSPKYNEQVYSNLKKTFIQTQIGDSVLNENANQATNINRHNIKLRGSFDWKLDSMNSLKITVGGNFYQTESEETRVAATTGEKGNLKNTSNRYTKSDNDKYSLTGNVIFKHKFKKLRRTISLTADWNMLNLAGTNFLQSVNQNYDPANPFILEVNQKIENDKSTQKVSSKFVYTEPLNKKFSLELGHEISYNKGWNELITYTYSNTSGKYDEQIDSLTNEFDQSILVNKPSVKISYSDKKIKYNFGSGFGLTSFDFIDQTFNKRYERNYTNFFPAATFNYSYKNNHNLRISYNGNTTQPTINQLQPLRNSNDQFNQYIGNPDLKPSFNNSFNLSHNGYDFIKDRWMHQSLNVNVTSNSITNNRVVDVNSGKTTTQPINTNGNISVSIWSGIGFKARKINTRFNINPNVRYSRFADVINNQVSYSKTTTAGMNFSMSKSSDKKYDINLWNDFSFNNNKNSQVVQTNHFYSNIASLDATIYINKVWSINSDYKYYFRQKTLQFSDDLNNQLWNAKFQRTFKKDEFTAYIKVRDILNQNIGIDRSFNGNSFREERNERLKRYFMVGFTWDFKNKVAQPK